MEVIKKLTINKCPSNKCPTVLRSENLEGVLDLSFAYLVVRCTRCGTLLHMDKTKQIKEAIKTH